MRVLPVLALCLAPLGAAAQDAATRDRDLLTAFLEDNLSGAGRQVVVTGFAGALSSQATIERLTIADARGIWLTLDGVVLDWSRSALFSGRVQVETLTARQVTLDRLPDPAESTLPAPEATPFALPDLPVSVDIGRLAADRVVLGATVLGQPVQGSIEASAALAGGEGRAQLRILRQDDGPDGTIDLQASYANASGQLVLDLDMVEGPGGLAVSALGLPGLPAARLRLAGAGPVTNFAATLALQTDGIDRLAGQVTTRGSDDGATAFAADLSGDLAPLFLPAYAGFFGDALTLTANGRRQADGALDLTAFDLRARSLALTGSLSLAADGVPQRFALDARLADPTGAPVLLPLSGPQTRIGAGEVRLSYDLAQGETWTGNATLSGFDRDGLDIDRLALDGSGRIGRQPDGRAVFGASLDFAARGLAPGDAALAAALGPDIDGKATLSWASGGDGLRIGLLSLTAGDLSAQVIGTVDGLSSGFGLSGVADLRAADLSRLAALAGRPLAGAAHVTLTGNGSPLGGDFDVETTVEGQALRLGQTEADNLLRGASAIRLSARRDATGLALRNLDVTAGNARLKAAGTLATAGSTLSGTIDFADLGVLGQGFRGGIDARAGFTGTLSDGRLTLSGTSRDLATGNATVDGLLGGPGRLDLDLRLAGDGIGLTAASIATARLTADATGRLSRTDSDLTLRAALSDLSALGPYRGALTAEARVTGGPDNGRILLRGEGRNLAIGQPEADRLLAGTSTLSADLALTRGRITVNAAQLANPQVTGTAKGTVTESERRIEIDARLANLALLLPEFPGPLTVTGTVRDSAVGYGVDLRATGPGQIAADVTGQIGPGFRRADLTARGTAQAALTNAFLGSRSISGALDFDLRLNGPFALSSLSGPLRLTGGRLADPDLPFSLADIAATARLGGGAALVEARGALTTGGTVTTAGRIGLIAPHPADLRLDLSSLRIRDPQLYETTLGGQLTLSGPLLRGPLLAGRLDLQQTELRIPETGLGGSGGLPDLRHRHEPGAVRDTRRKAGLLAAASGDDAGPAAAVRLDLLVSAPNRVFLRGRGLDVELGGELRLRGTSAAVIPSGGLQLIRGRLDILGKRLVLDSATLDFEGDLVPMVEIRATTVSDSAATTVVIEGPAAEPEVRFESSPDLPQEEILAQLLFGQGLQNLSALQAAQLATAVARLAGRGGEGIAGRLRKSFGLDDLDLSTAEGEGTTLRAGKYLSDKVYTEVEIEQGGKSRINLNLDLRPGVTVKGSVGSEGETGIGIYLEKDY
jgi:translocation and assembly module TamB